MLANTRTLIVVRLILLACFISASAVLLRFTSWGPFHLLLPVNSPVNAESVIALSFVLLLFLSFSFPTRTHLPTAWLTQHRFQSSVTPVALIILITALSFCMSLNIPLLYDAYGDVENAAHQTFAQVFGTFYQHPVSGDFFFRPIGNLTYWFDFKWAGFNPFYWHLWNLAAHISTSILVYVFARQLALDRVFAVISALVFAIHGSRPEVASWVGERFDMLAALFVLLSLVSFNRYLDDTENRRLWYSFMLGCFILALLSKESAYCLPLLLLGLIPFKPESSRRKIIQSAIVLLGTAMAVFLYRHWVLRGIGGYKTGGGGETILRFSAMRTLKGLFFREWAFLFFPVNWSSNLEWWTKLSIVIFLVVMCGVLVYSRSRRTYLLSSLFWAIAASLPVQHLLLINQELTGARVLYLPMLGITLFWGFLLQGCRQWSLAIPLSIALIVSQLIVLQHNLSIWRRAALLSQKTCRLLGEELSRTGETAIVVGLTPTWHGIYFLRNGFSACVAMNSQASIDQVKVDQVQVDQVQVKEDVNNRAARTRVFIWNPASDRLDEQ
jgi:hypothetical protein